MGLEVEEVEEQVEKKQNLVRDTHKAAKRAINPSEAVREMAESDEYEGVAFDRHEIIDYINESLEKAEEGNIRHSDREDEAANETINYAAELNSEQDYETSNPKEDPSIGVQQVYLEGAFDNSDDIMEIHDDEGDSYFMSQESYENRKE